MTTRTEHSPKLRKLLQKHIRISQQPLVSQQKHQAWQSEESYNNGWTTDGNLWHSSRDAFKTLNRGITFPVGKSYHFKHYGRPRIHCVRQPQTSHVLFERVFKQVLFLKVLITGPRFADKYNTFLGKQYSCWPLSRITSMKLFKGIILLKFAQLQIEEANLQH